MLPTSLLFSLLGLLPSSVLGQATPTTLFPPLYPSSTSLPSIPASYLGISLELSALSSLLGPGVPSSSSSSSNTSLPLPLLNYLQAIQSRMGAPLRLRIGGNSMDSSTYSPSQNTTLLEVLDPEANNNNVPVSFGPLLFSTLSFLSLSINATYTLGLPLLTPNVSSSYVPLAQAEGSLLEPGMLDLVLVGNEPDLYYDHGERPGVGNYTVEDYVGEVEEEVVGMGSDLPQGVIGGPTICCNWDLAALLPSYLSSPFSSQVKAITLQHYPQNNCFGTHAFPLSYYLSHSNVVGLAGWQAPGVALARQEGKEVRMTEFNTASCGGVPGISDTFASTLWTIDYSLQLATVGFTSAQIHTREPGVSYNVFSPPNTTLSAGTLTTSSPPIGSGEASEQLRQLGQGWTTGVMYWPLLVVAEALGGANGTFGAGYTAPVDLNLSSDTTAGYALYTSTNGWELSALVLINYGTTNNSYSVPSTLFAGGVGMETKLLLSADTTTTSPVITWAGQGMSPEGDGTLQGAEVVYTQTCSSASEGAGGCTVNVPGPGAALVRFFAGNSTSGSAGGGGGGAGGGGGPSTITVVGGQPSGTSSTAGAGPTTRVESAACRSHQGKSGREWLVAGGMTALAALAMLWS